MVKTVRTPDGGFVSTEGLREVQIIPSPSPNGYMLYGLATLSTAMTVVLWGAVVYAGSVGNVVLAIILGIFGILGLPLSGALVEGIKRTKEIYHVFGRFEKGSWGWRSCWYDFGTFNTRTEAQTFVRKLEEVVSKKEVKSMIRVELSTWPPSTNKLYTVVRGRKKLSTEGLAYHRTVKFAVAQSMPEVVRPNEPYTIRLFLYREDWINKGWPGTKHKFKIIDLSNRIKCVEDAVAEALAMDDSQFFEVNMKKCRGKKKIVIEVERFVPGQEWKNAKEKRR